MADGDFLARIDAHMERGNEEMRLTREFMADNRTFTQQMIVRVDRMTRDNAKAMDRMASAMDRMAGATDRMADRLGRNTDELARQGAEQREENRAGREALFALIDRMNRLDPPDARG